MFKRMDEILIEITKVEKPDPNVAAAVLKPFYDLVMSITAEEIGHVELVSHAMP